MPLYKLFRFLATSPRLGLHRQRAITITSVLVLMILVFLAAVPMPERVRVPGMVEAANYRQLYSESAGSVAQLVAEPGTRVKVGQVLLRMENPQLDAELQSTHMQLAQVVAQELRAMNLSPSDLQPLQQQRQALEETRAELERQQRALQVIAPIDGVWAAADNDVAKGRWVARGGSLGAVVDANGEWRFVAVLPQVSTFLFEGELAGAEIRLAGQEDDNMIARQARVLPHEQGVLPSRALGMAGGGEIAVQPNDPHGVTAAEPFFRVQAQLAADDHDYPVLMHGRLGVMRLDLGFRPLLSQGERAMRQFFQRKFRV
jgi:putative peptide zinc metalloprotease protein